MKYLGSKVSFGRDKKAGVDVAVVANWCLIGAQNLDEEGKEYLVESVPSYLMEVAAMKMWNITKEMLVVKTLRYFRREGDGPTDGNCFRYDIREYVHETA